MKKSFIAIAALTALVSCNKVEGTFAEKTVDISATATLDEAVKAQFGVFSENKYSMKWNEAEQVLLNEYAYGETTVLTEKGSKKWSKVDETTACFGFELPAKEEYSQYDYYAVTPYSMSNATSINGARLGRNKTMPEGFETCTSYALLHAANLQTPLADAPDSTTHIMVAKLLGQASQPKTLNLQFKSVVSYGKMKITGFPALASGEIPSKIVITAPAGTVMRGRLWHNAKDEVAPFSDNAQSNFVNVNPENITFNTTGFDVWFTTFPFSMKAGDKLDVSVTTNKSSYTASITLSKALEFKAGVVSSFTYSWTNGQPQPTGDKVLTFDFSGSALDGWPTTTDSGVCRKVDCVYKLAGTEYTFRLIEPDFAKDGKIYWGAKGFYMAVYRSLAFPLIPGYCLKSVTCTISKQVSQSSVAINDFIVPGNTIKHPDTYAIAAQAWNAAAGTEKTYEVNAKDPTHQYYLYCKNNEANMSKLVLTYSLAAE